MRSCCSSDFADAVSGRVSGSKASSCTCASDGASRAYLNVSGMGSWDRGWSLSEK